MKPFVPGTLLITLLLLTLSAAMCQENNDSAAPPVSRVRVSQGVSQALLLHRVRPIYPTKALQDRIQGTVVLQAYISKEGNVEDLKLVSGHPALSPAAIDAVKLWKYKPYLLNGEPVSIETTVNVNFILASP